MKLSVAITLLGLFGVASSKCLHQFNAIGNAVMKTLIGANKHKLTNLTIPKIDLMDYGNVSNIVIVGAENFVLTNFTDESFFNMNIANASIMLNTASATADIHFKNYQVPGSKLVVNGNGQVRGSAKNMSISAHLHIAHNGFNFFLEDFTSMYFRVEEVQGELSGVENAAATNEIINSKLKDYLNANVVALAEKHKKGILRIISNASLLKMTRSFTRKMKQLCAA